MLLDLVGPFQSAFVAGRNISDNILLSPNLDKSSMFLCGVEPNTKLQLLGALGYREGKSPFRYLGVPLITTKVSSYDCLILVDRIIA